ncbi:DNA polymerase subunit gamma-2, mitochondrial [Drosophila ficusphila]|uniref:DNA polymerase subunit gamma-2, mitochondrial n=1 Tax=Drosophila ficusphila TaxID=30025 RepID=UPI0007E69A18|nr:DNA polymerase subunit gamma-2, mitochondrial [Drosophila ficusphila]
MSRIQRCFKSLESAGFFRSHDDNILELLCHGKEYAKLLQQHWLRLRPLAAHLDDSIQTISPSNLHRFSFPESQQFGNNFQKLIKDHPRKAKCPTLIKHQSLSSSPKVNPLFGVKSPATLLTTDFLVEPHRALEHFYNMQRESKIWWMRLSSNPSRYRIVPCDLGEEYNPKNYQAIDIKSSYGEAGDVTVEELSLVRIVEDNGYRLSDARTGEFIQPTVIRSVIELETATCALLLDGCDHGRDAQSLLLHRVLAPYQCGIACVEGESELSGDLADLCLHLKHVIHLAGLRLREGTGFASAKNTSQLKDHLLESDMLGVPYTLVLNEQTLKNGLMQLRSRDTRLAETIHISDVPDYLLNIFKN